ncbi:MAG: phosphatase PAP2 family protein [Firmicutes bacterium]|nr:phosphatase PAP2 family protein [Bacillota bacterium]
MTEFFAYLAEHFDLPILDWIAAHLYCPALDFIVPLITKLGNGGAVWIVLAVVLLCIPKTRRAGFTVALSLIVGLVLCNGIIKPLVGRIRPYDYVALLGREVTLLVPRETDAGSFPSGHANASFAAATALTFFHKKLGIAALVLALLIALTRLYLYVHYPTDILCGIATGVCTAFIANAIVSRIYDRRIAKQD